MTVKELISLLSTIQDGGRKVYYITKNTNEAQLKKLEIDIGHSWINLVVEEK